MRGPNSGIRQRRLPGTRIPDWLRLSLGIPRSEIRALKPHFIFVLATAAVLVLGAVQLRAATNSSAAAETNSSAADQVPKLRPPLPELPPTFWEQHQTGIMIGVALLAVVAALGVWYLMRPKPPVCVPPAVQAHEALDSLRRQPETGVVLSKVSQVIRYYFTNAFGLPQVELTTTEFCQSLAQVDQIDPHLSSELTDFLRKCDQRKFAPTPLQPPLAAVSLAEKFIDQAEAQRAALAQTSANAAGARAAGQTSKSGGGP